MRTENSRHAQTVALIAWFDVAVLLSHLLEDPPQGVVTSTASSFSSWTQFNNVLCAFARAILPVETQKKEVMHGEAA